MSSPDHRRRILDRWDRSGLSAAAFAPSVGVTPWTLYAWRRRERKLAERSAPCTAIVPSFVEIAIDDARAPASPASAAPIEIALPRDITVRVAPGFDAQTLKRVVDTLVA